MSTSMSTALEEESGPRGRRGTAAKPATAHARKDSEYGLEEGLLLQVDIFLSELERRLDLLESYGNVDVDAGIGRAYATLQAVRARCSQVSGEFLGAGRRRARIMVETVESRYQDALVAKETLNEKIHTGIMLLETMLSDFETRTYKMREQGFAGAAGTLMDEGRRVVDEGIGRAREVVDESFERAREVVDEGFERAREVVDEGIERARKAAETLEEHVESAVQRARERGLIRYEDLPKPWQVNPHIVGGYRFSETKIDCLRSVFRLSNELINIWSHGIGLMVMLSIAFHFYPSSANFSISTTADVFIAAVFFFAACKCLVCSCMWHTMNSVADHTLLERFACVDYTGISLLIAASIMTTEYTAFYCEPVSRWIYITLTAFLGVGGVILPWHPTFNRSDMAWIRVAFYVTLSATGFAPVLQLTLTRGSGWAWQFYAPITKSIAVYLVGALVYAAKVPERWFPGFFDYLGASHNLWHLAVLGGIYFHYVAMEQFFAGAFERRANECAAFM